MMHRYEALVLSVPTITQDEAKNLEDQFARLAENHKIEVLSFERWGKYRLAYPVLKNEYGVYYLSRFESESPGEFLIALKALFSVKLTDIVLRYLVNKLDTNASLEYERPQSLEEVPARDKDAVLGKSGIEKILTTADSSKAERDLADDTDSDEDSDDLLDEGDRDSQDDE